MMRGKCLHIINADKIGLINKDARKGAKGMKEMKEGNLLWEPKEERVQEAGITKYMNWLREEKELDFNTQTDIWNWSVKEIEAFWETVWEYGDVIAHQPYTNVLAKRQMPGAKWFEGATLNYAEQIFQHHQAGKTAIISKTEIGATKEMSWTELQRQTANIAHYLRSLGVEKGDRVVAYMPNTPETVIAFLACASIGAIWSVCSPDFGISSVLERFKQIEPKVLFAADGYYYNGKTFDRISSVGSLQDSLPTVEQTILFPFIGSEEEKGLDTQTVMWGEASAGNQELVFEALPFDHPLWVLFSSGTTGLPKPIVQGHGGIVLEHLKVLKIEQGIKEDDVYFWYTSTGWMMWNLLMGGLLTGTTIVLYDGSPGYPELAAMWDLAEEVDMTFFGTSAAYIGNCMNHGLSPKASHQLPHLQTISSTGSPLTIDAFAWVYEHVKDDVWLVSTSGGTDLCTAFVGGSSILPVRAGEIQTRSLGASIHALDENGDSLINEVGELVLTEPMPSMPLYFWEDTNNARYMDSYFDMFPGIWRHGDWIKIDDKGSCVIYGRSDSTINRQGVRLGTSEIYRVIDAHEAVLDSLVIDLEHLGRHSFLALFVELQDGVILNDELKAMLKMAVKKEVSPRFQPNEVYEVKQIPKTLSGKKMEVPIRKILLGFEAEKVVNKGSMTNPASLDYFKNLAEEWNA